jgi:hypothetical protein
LSLFLERWEEKEDTKENNGSPNRPGFLCSLVWGAKNQANLLLRTPTKHITYEDKIMDDKDANDNLMYNQNQDSGRRVTRSMTLS